ncbi:sulfurtransferase TusA family protein [Candidatus Korarchaeum cryptofilum]|uniref:Predicted redox protein n=2 Tax=Candidatus Korarchaeum cryptofilum TaxID=498846 RepID=B1L7H0_KORCO|nr:sulfurtransferase TusA family protein [Candidatus Korarchaeum cryptofilum]ACB06797.1 Predicted redox protein [Candidatus Korarchaeum cryptofilum OPF8]RSN69041.1 sulfurtransferase TusA family protein [Candidatus Korarchaeum cryptofilum]
MRRAVDLRGMKSPRAIVEIAKLVKKATPGETLDFLVGDKGTMDDLYEWISRTGHMLKVSERGDHWLVQITKREG